MAERTFRVGSVSKTHSMSGYRCGWIAGPAGSGDRLADVLAAGSLGVAPFVQDAVRSALESGPGAIEAARGEYRARRDAFVQGLGRMSGLRAPMPESGMFVMLDVSGSGWDGTAFAWGLLDRGVCVIPGEAFGAGHGGAVRVGLCEPASRMREAAVIMAGLAREGARSRPVSIRGVSPASTRGVPCRVPPAGSALPA